MEVLDRYNFKVPDKLTYPLVNKAALPFPVLKRDDKVKHTFVLAIGNNEGVASRPLKYAEKDAYDFAGLLQYKNRMGVTHSMVLTGPQANLKSIQAAFKWLEASTRPQDEVQIMISGHGILDFRTQHYFFLSYDPKNRLTDENLISDIWLTSLVGSLSGSVKFYLDTCYSNNFNDYLLIHRPVMRSYFMTSYASSSSWMYSYEDWNNKNGYFSSAVLLGLSGNADRNHDGHITDLEMSEYVNKLTPLLSRGLQKSSTYFHQNF